MIKKGAICSLNQNFTQEQCNNKKERRLLSTLYQKKPAYYLIMKRIDTNHVLVVFIYKKATSYTLPCNINGESCGACYTALTCIPEKMLVNEYIVNPNVYEFIKELYREHKLKKERDQKLKEEKKQKRQNKKKSQKKKSRNKTKAKRMKEYPYGTNYTKAAPSKYIRVFRG